MLVSKSIKRFSPLGSADFLFFAKFYEIKNMFGEPDEKETSNTNPPRYIWYCQFFDGSQFTLSNDALRNDPIPEKNESWMVHFGTNSCLQKMLRLLEIHAQKEWIPFIFEKYDIKR